MNLNESQSKHIWSGNYEATQKEKEINNQKEVKTDERKEVEK